MRKIIGVKVKTLCPLKSKGGTVIEKRRNMYYSQKL